MSLLHPTHNPAVPVVAMLTPSQYRDVLDSEKKALRAKLAASINESLSAESESFANYLATKLMREFNVTLKD